MRYYSTTTVSAVVLCASVLVLAGCASSPRDQSQSSGTATAQTGGRVDTCPPVLGTGSPANGNTGNELEPLDAAKLLVCGYRRVVSNGSPSVSLAAQAQTTDLGTVRGLRRIINALPGVPAGSVSCGNDNGSATLLIFSDATSSVELRENMTGCQTVTNGASTGWVGPSAVGTSVMALLPQTFCESAWSAAACAQPSPRPDFSKTG